MKALTLVVALVALGLSGCGGSKSAETLPPLHGHPIADPHGRVNRALAVASEFWQHKGQHLKCHTPVKVVTVDHDTEMFEHRAVSYWQTSGDTCELQYSPKVAKSYSWPEFCLLTVQEYGGLLGNDYVKNPRSIMYDDLSTATYHLPGCSNNPAETRFYAPPIDTPAHLCVFRIDQNAPSFSVGAKVANCQSIEYLSFGHGFLVHEHPHSCRAVIHVLPASIAPRPTHYRSDIYGEAFQLGNPERCRVVVFSVVATESVRKGFAWEEVWESPEALYYQPSLVFL